MSKTSEILHQLGREDFINKSEWFALVPKEVLTPPEWAFTAQQCRYVGIVTMIHMLDL